MIVVNVLPTLMENLNMSNCCLILMLNMWQITQLEEHFPASDTIGTIDR